MEKSSAFQRWNNYMREQNEKAGKDHEEKLLPCPFCGGKAELENWKLACDEIGTIINCTVCDACVSEGVDNGNGWRERTVKKWNRRTQANVDTLCEDSFQVHLLEEIKRLEQKNTALREQLARITAERDAALNDLRGKCSVCVHYTPNHNEGVCAHCCREYMSDVIACSDCWQWRGPQKEDGGNDE